MVLVVMFVLVLVLVLPSTPQVVQRTHVLVDENQIGRLRRVRLSSLDSFLWNHRKTLAAVFKTSSYPLVPALLSQPRSVIISLRKKDLHDSNEGTFCPFRLCVIVINRCNAKRNNCNAFSFSSSDFASSASIVAVKTPTYGLPLPATPSGVSGWLRSRGRRRWCHLGLHASLVPEMQRPADPWKQFQGVSRRSTHISEGFITV